MYLITYVQHYYRRFVIRELLLQAIFLNLRILKENNNYLINIIITSKYTTLVPLIKISLKSSVSTLFCTICF